MSIKIVLLATLVASVVAFRPTAVSRVSVNKISMLNAENLAGATAPLGYFDPMGLSEGKSKQEIKKYREAELKHGRLAMVAFLGILVGENWNPLFEQQISGPAIYQFQEADALNTYLWVFVLFGVALVEGINISKGWESFEETAVRDSKSTVAELKENYVNGDLGFDPLGLRPTGQAEFDLIRTKEINNGRLAMIAVAGIIAQELVNGKGFLQNFGFEALPVIAIIDQNPIL
mmetsp:Transcript_32151/g.30647  ORF Transcript_32151/g.30647 Transcript_32151/m.30647 type:complete len:232 (+) Transcript_32151:57-752(+)|eukprot:CAMPEP_0119046578 /NCGR_PEP_ID=MMETSP1177-20130426/47579_1 /TAXON_ID=2985 /ORGANISM="Ochromonas sp, Strain CCMP1899" /LENGTH=231 /DNA_ID=CAMNT_0007019925 /DNA_START=29 /DNA_END=724 /DNA_ORIENTATION=-